jgi:AcrR family transcriptional regulator
VRLKSHNGQYRTVSIDGKLRSELTGKARTRAGVLAATRTFLAEGVTPTVEQAARRAGISRTTAYRYFPNQRALLLASHPELEAHSLLDGDAPPTATARLELVIERIARQTFEHEPELRAMLRLSLELPRPHRDALPLRQGRAITWIDDALAPLRERISKRSPPARACDPRDAQRRGARMADRYRRSLTRTSRRPHARVGAHAAASCTRRCRNH